METERINMLLKRMTATENKAHRAYLIQLVAGAVVVVSLASLTTGTVIGTMYAKSQRAALKVEIGRLEQRISVLLENDLVRRLEVIEQRLSDGE